MRAIALCCRAQK